MTVPAREAIVEAAFRLFLDRGYAATSLSRIVEVVPYSKGAVYHHFANKEALLDAVVERFFAAPVADAATAAAAGAPSASALAHRLVDEYVATLGEVSGFASATSYYAFVCSIAPRASEAIRRAQERAVADLADALRRDGDPAPQDTAGDLVALVEGHGLLAVLRGDGPSAERLHAAVDRLLAGGSRGAAVP